MPFCHISISPIKLYVIRNSAAAHVAMRKLAVFLADSQDLRIILSVLYTMTEVIRNEKENMTSEHEAIVDSFTQELGWYKLTPDNVLSLNVTCFKVRLLVMSCLLLSCWE